MTVTNLTAQSVAIRGRLVEPGLVIDPNTGAAVVSKNSFIAFFTADVASISADIVNENFENWTVEFTSPGGEVKKGRLIEPVINRSFGYVQSPIRKAE